MIEAKNITYKISDRTILDNLNITLEPEKITSILGPNGVGKSTLLSCLCGSQPLDGGEILLDNKLISEYSLQELAMKRAVLSQSSIINFAFTVMEIVLMGRNPYSYENNKIRDTDIAQEALNSVDAYHLKDRIYPTLSGGEQQRVQLARVFAQLWEQNNACLFLDEPTSALDLKHQHQVLTFVRRLSRQLKFTICIVIHDLGLARFYSDNVVLIKNSSDLIMDHSSIALTRENISNVFDVPINLVRETVMINEVAA